ncbi:MAG: hypothetical protein AAGF94_08305 [Pseudomonadota bacterium]
MSTMQRPSTCLSVCWIAGGIAGILLAYATRNALPVVIAVGVGVVFGVGAAIVMGRVICHADKDDWGPFEGLKGNFDSDKTAEETETAQSSAAPSSPAPSSAAPSSAAKPETLDGPKNGAADDLKKLNGVGPKLEELMNENGIYHYEQIASWTPEQVAWIEEKLSFKGRIERDGWIAQAKEFTAQTN